MGIAVLDLPVMTDSSFGLGTIGAFYEPSDDMHASFVHSDETLLSRLMSVTDKILLSCLESRSPNEFRRSRGQLLPKYVRSLRALSDTMSNLATDDQVERMWAVSLPLLSADLEKQRDIRFGDELTDQALFTLSTLEKIRELGREIARTGKPSSRKVDRKLQAEYQMNSLWAQFHLDTMFAAMKFRKTIPATVEPLICDGLRATVNAYSIMKEALALRSTHVEEQAGQLPWDEEDDELLASSMREINAFSADR